MVETVLERFSSVPLTLADQCQFQTDGALLLKEVFTPADFQPILDQLAQRITLLEEKSSLFVGPQSDSVANLNHRILQLEEHSPGSQGVLYDAMPLSPAMARFASEPKLLEILKIFLSPTIEIHPRLILLMSLPQATWHLAGWHQDWYYNEGPESTITVYIPLQRTDEENGSLLLALGEHHRGLLPHEDHDPSTKWHTLPPDTVETFSRVVSTTVDVGDLLIFNSLVPHCARVNQSNQLRLVINLRYRDLMDPVHLKNHWRIAPIQRARQALARVTSFSG